MQNQEICRRVIYRRSPPLLTVCITSAIIEPSYQIAATTLQRLVERVEAQQREVIMIKDTENNEIAPTAAEYLADVLMEMQSLAVSAIRLAAQQSDWKALHLAMAAREQSERWLIWLNSADEGDA